MIPWQMTEYWRYHKYLVLFVLNDQQMGTFHKIELSIIGHFANVGFIVFSLVFLLWWFIRNQNNVTDHRKTIDINKKKSYCQSTWPSLTFNVLLSQCLSHFCQTQSMQCLKWSEASTLVGTAVYFPERPICSQIQINENRESCQKCRLQLNLKGVRTLFKFVTKKWLMTQIPRSWQLAGFLFSVSTLPDSFNISVNFLLQWVNLIWLIGDRQKYC